MKGRYSMQAHPWSWWDVVLAVVCLVAVVLVLWGLYSLTQTP